MKPSSEVALNLLHYLSTYDNLLLSIPQPRRVTMRMFVVPVLMSLSLSGPLLLGDQQKLIPINDPLKALPDAALRLLDSTQATLKYEDAEKFIDLAQAAPALTEGAYCILHIVRWNPYTNDNKFSLDKQNWYVFQRKPTSRFTSTWTATEFKGTRLFGTTKVLFIYVYLGATSPTQLTVTYNLSVTQKTPENIQNLEALAKFVTLGASPIGAYYQAKYLDISYETSDLKFTAYVTPPGGDSPKTPIELTNMTFDNEGRHRWDVSFAVPLKSYKDVQLNASGNQIQPTTVTRQNVFATFDLFPVPVDTKHFETSFVPHLVAGLPISGKPLDRFLVALGLGTSYFSGFVGVGFDKRVVSVQGTTALPPGTGDQWVRKLSFGIEVPLIPTLNGFKSAKK